MPLYVSGSITLADLNPMDYKIGNDYISKLYKWNEYLNQINSVVTGLRITRSFEPESILREKCGDKFNWYHRAFSRCNAISLTWDSFEQSLALQIAKAIADTAKDTTKTIIDLEDNSLTILRGMKSRSTVTIKNSTGKKIVHTASSK